MLDDATRRQLQQLRFLLEEALARTQELTEIGRHSALVLLDGACEFAMALALDHKGLRLAERFPQKYNDLRAGIPDWKPDTWRSINALHQARNLAQHHGVVTDASFLPTWAAQTQRFISSLVQAAFDVELQSVLVADAIETEEVRRLLVQAEHALSQEDAAVAFDAAIAGFDIARAEWQGQRAESISQVTLQYSGLGFLVGGEETDPINRSLLRFEGLLEVQPFAPDIAEYHWLVARRGEAEQNLPPSLDTARRAFQFVVAWVLRWEAFAARYEARRYPPSPPPYEPPVIGADHPVIYDASVETLHHIGGWLDDPTLDNVRYAARVTLADIPGEHRELWAQQIGDVLNEIISERGSESASGASVDAGGIVRVHGVTGRASGPEIRNWIEEALIRGDERYRQTLLDRQELDSRLPALRAAFEQALKGVETGDIVSGVTSELREDGNDWLGIRLQIVANEDPLLLQVLQESALAAIAGRPGISFFHNTLWFCLDHEPEAAASVAAQTADSYRTRSAARARNIADVEMRRHGLENELSGNAVKSQT